MGGVRLVKCLSNKILIFHNYLKIYRYICDLKNEGIEVFGSVFCIKENLYFCSSKNKFD